MICNNPWQQPDRDGRPGLSFSCGGCRACRINRRNIWTTRLVLESAHHSKSCFVTLTYNNDTLPNDNSVKPLHLKAFIRAVRFKYGSFRYYAVGEYGEQGSRPHYHAILFGLSLSQAQLAQLWGKGHTLSGSVTHESAQYVSGYISSTLNPEKLAGRHSEFSRMSLRPGIGHLAVAHLVRFHRTDAGIKYLEHHRDVINVVRYGGKVRPIGKYIIRKTREALGIPHVDPTRDHYTATWEEADFELHEKKRIITNIRLSKPLQQRKRLL